MRLKTKSINGGVSEFNYCIYVRREFVINEVCYDCGGAGADLAAGDRPPKGKEFKNSAYLYIPI